MIDIKYKTLSEAFLDIENCDNTHNFINGQNQISITSKELKKNVFKILNYMINKDVKPGDEVILQIKNNLDFIQFFWACILGNFIPIPYTYIEKEGDIFKLLNIWNNLKSPYLVTDRKFLKKLDKFSENNKKIYNINNKVILAEEITGCDKKINITMPNESDIAFIQFSSGSTSDPKGIIITHKNVISSVKETLKAMKVSKNDIYLNWLPLTHSFGLIGMCITPFLANLKYYILPCQLFVSNPLLWLKKIEEHKATITAAPNFALKHVCKYIDLDKNFQVNLSSLRIIIDGAEPVSPEICKLFNDKMSNYKMNDTVLRPSYGLSEATLVVSTSKFDEKFKVVNILRNHIKIGQKVIQSLNNDNTIGFTEVGSCINNCEIKIVDENDMEVNDLVVGRILLKGDMIFKGYYNNTLETKNVFINGWYETGDLGFLKDGNLVITGRVKDVFFINGENYYSHDIESICYEISKNKFSRVAICGIYNSAKKQTEVVCFLEYKNTHNNFQDIAFEVKKYVMKKTGLAFSRIIPVKEIPVTVSGKIKRYLLANKYIEGCFKQHNN